MEAELMNIADKIYEEASRLPEHLAQEVLDFIGYIEKKHGLSEKEIGNFKEAQAIAMGNVWGNDEDEVWNEHPSC
jgi:hypothetical protein